MHWVLVFGHLDYPNGTRNLDPASQEGSGSIEYYKRSLALQATSKMHWVLVFGHLDYPNGTRNLDPASQEGSGSRPDECGVRDPHKR